MNIFVLDKDPKKCAEYHNDKHVVKMILETAQLLCGVHHMAESKLDIPYRLSHKNHPCSIWARECIENYVWLCDLGMELCKEYTYRYGKRHKSQDIIEWCITNHPPLKETGDLLSTRQGLLLKSRGRTPLQQVLQVEGRIYFYQEAHQGQPCSGYRLLRPLTWRKMPGSRCRRDPEF